MKFILPILLSLVLALSSTAAISDSPIQTISASESMGVVEQTITDIVTNSVDKLQAIAILWLSSFMLIQFVITNIGLLKSGADIEAVFAKFLGSIFWFGFCFYLIAEGSGFIEKVGGSFFDILSSLTGGGMYSTGELLNSGVGIGANLISTVQHVAGITDVGSVIIAGVCGFFVLGVVAFIAFKLFLIKIELALVIMMSPISFAFLGLNALKDQGIAPFKALISLMYRIIILGVIIMSIDQITNKVSGSISSIYDSAGFFSKISGIGNGVWPALLGIVASYAILGFLAFKSDSIAASLSSGSTNMGTADVASAAALGAATGAALATGGAAAAGAAGKSSQTMGDFMKSLMGGGKGEISNAAPTGKGGPVGEPPIKPPAQSLGPTDANGAPVRPEPSETNSTPDPQTTDSPEPSPEPAGSGASAGIGGAGSGLEKQVGDLVKAMSQPKNPTLKDRLGDVNRQVAQESASTHVSINTHHAD